MTGALKVCGVDSLAYQDFVVDDVNWPPRFCKLELAFDGGAKLAFVDPRRIGRVRLAPAVAPRGGAAFVLASAPLRVLAPDPFCRAGPGDTAYGGAAGVARFLAGLSRSGAAIKAVLLDQTKVCAGVGNWIADDALLRARIHPATPAAAVAASPSAAARLHDAVASVIREACRCDADSARFPKNWLFHVRWGRKKGGRTRDGQAVKYIKVAGRTTAFVPAVQKKLACRAGERAGPAKGKPSKGKKRAAPAAAAAATAAAAAAAATKQRGQPKRHRVTR
jgi:formamidopyrimidine-DNA glycosylase